MAELELDELQAWVGKTEHTEDVVDPRRSAQLAGALGNDTAPAAGEPLPLPWYWTLFSPVVAAAATGADGHPEKGGFMPPVPLPRRMWAGSRVDIKQDLVVGEKVSCESRIADVRRKSGRQGPLVFVTVERKYNNQKGELAISERQDIVYREPPTQAPPPAPVHEPETGPDWTETIQPNPVLLFRYSALTYNGHRIHYDRNWATSEEGYPGLVVQGPLTATLLLNSLHHKLPDVAIAGFSFRGVNPLFDLAPFTVCGSREGDDVRLWALTPEGQLAMTMDVALIS
ncbi:MAG: HTD2 family dehydratase [Planctomycetota bacterium]|jgi:3-methylfumaryl-CoA hydratase